MKSKGFSVGLLLSILVLGVGIVFGQDADVISPANAAKLKQIWQITDQERIFDTNIVFSPDSKLLAFHQNENIQLWDVAANKATMTLASDTFPAKVIFTDEGKMIEAVTTSFLNSISSWDLASGDALPIVKTKDPIDTSTTIVSPDGSLVGAILYEKKSLQIIDAATGETVTTVPAYGMIALSPDNKMLAVGDNNTKMELWDVAAGKMTTSLESPSKAYGYPIFSADGKLLAGCNINDGVDIWDVETGKTITSMPDASCGAGAMFSPDNKLFASGFANIYLYDVEKGKELFKIEDASNVAFSPDGKYVATVSAFSNILTLWGL
jgi:WD40 repeat protein